MAECNSDVLLALAICCYTSGALKQRMTLCPDAVHQYVISADLAVSYGFEYK